MDLNVLLFLLHCDIISAGCELMRRSRFSSLESETDNPSAGVVITTRPEAPSGSIRLHEDPHDNNRLPCDDGGAAGGARRDNKQIKEFYFCASFIFQGLFTSSGLHEVNPAWPVSTQMKQADGSLQRFISPPALHFQKHLVACQCVCMSSVENECFAHHTRFWFCGLMDRITAAVLWWRDRTAPLEQNTELGLVSRRRAGMLRVHHREAKDESVKVACPHRVNNYLL